MDMARRHPAAHHETDRTAPRAARNDQANGPATEQFNTRAIGFVMGWELYDPAPDEAETLAQAAQS